MEDRPRFAFLVGEPDAWDAVRTIIALVIDGDPIGNLGEPREVFAVGGDDEFAGIITIAGRDDDGVIGDRPQFWLGERLVSDQSPVVVPTLRDQVAESPMVCREGIASFGAIAELACVAFGE
jgi:hypothetical protein